MTMEMDSAESAGSSGRPRSGRESRERHERWERIWSHREHLLKVARRRSVCLDDAEDAVHEAMLRAWENPHVDDARLGAWLTTVTVRLCVDRHRQLGRETREAAEENLPAVGAPWQQASLPVDEAVCDRFEASWLARRSQELPPRQAEALWLKSADLDVGQVAEKMGLSYRTVESLLARARRTLRHLVAGTLAVGAYRWLASWPRSSSEGVLAGGGVVSTAVSLAVLGGALPPGEVPQGEGPRSVATSAPERSASAREAEGSTAGEAAPLGARARCVEPCAGHPPPGVAGGWSATAAPSSLFGTLGGALDGVESPADGAALPFGTDGALGHGPRLPAASPRLQLPLLPYSAGALPRPSVAGYALSAPGQSGPLMLSAPHGSPPSPGPSPAPVTAPLGTPSAAPEGVRAERNGDGAADSAGAGEGEPSGFAEGQGQGDVSHSIPGTPREVGDPPRRAPSDQAAPSEPAEQPDQIDTDDVDDVDTVGGALDAGEG